MTEDQVPGDQIFVREGVGYLNSSQSADFMDVSNTTFRKLVETYRIPYQNFLGKSRVNYFRVDHLKQLKNASESQLEKLAKEEITIDDLLVKENTPD